MSELPKSLEAWIEEQSADSYDPANHFAGGARAMAEHLMPLVSKLKYINEEFKMFPDRRGGYYGCDCLDEVREIIERNEKFEKDSIGMALAACGLEQSDD